MLGPNLLRLAEPVFVPQHDHIVNIPVSLTGSEVMEPDLIIFVYIHHETLFGVGVKWAKGIIPIFSDALETNTQQPLEQP
jgi:hypothetical protein